MKTKDDLRKVNETQQLFRIMMLEGEDLKIELNASEIEGEEMSCREPEGDVVSTFYQVNEIPKAFSDFNELVKKEYEDVTLSIYCLRSIIGTFIMRIHKDKVNISTSVNITDVNSKVTDKMARIQKIIEEP